jgi:hypothetical protein
MVLLMSFTACEQKELFLCPPPGDVPVDVVIHWDSIPDDVLYLPQNMTIHWYSESGTLIASDLSAFGGWEWMEGNTYNVICLDFHGNSTLAFRSNGTLEDFEVYNTRMAGLYNTHVPPLPGGEVTVAEATPDRFYIDSRPQTIDTRNVPPGDTLVLNFYPQNVLREFTFLVYDVIGAKYMSENSGAMSGMSGSYFPASGRLASTPSTILFSRVEAIPNGQTSPRWTDEDKARFAAINPNWADPDTLTGWTRDWIIGKFVTFGPLLDTQDNNLRATAGENRFRLTIEALGKSNNYFNGSWGYYHGEYENTVVDQIYGAMGKNGTPEEQAAWRQRNGGYDMIIYNDNRLVVPESEGGNGGGTSDGGFTVSVDDWGDIIDVPTANSKSNSKPVKSSRLNRFNAQKAPINTELTIPDFVVNGIYSDGSRIFDEQYVYKPESGIIWDYAPKKYWPSTGAIDFYAYAPAGIKSKNLITGLSDVSNDPNPPILEYTMSYKEQDTPPPGTGEPASVTVDDRQEDLLVAVQHRMSPQTSAVPMNFRHAFSRVTVKAQTDLNPKEHRIKVTRVDLRNLYINGKLKLDPDLAVSAPSTGIPMEEEDLFQYDDDGMLTLWKEHNILGNYRFKLLSPVIPIENEYTTLLLQDDGILVIPQTVESTVLYVEYDIYTVSLTGGEKYETSATQRFSLTPGFVAFEIGRQYELKVTLDAP